MKGSSVELEVEARGLMSVDGEPHEINLMTEM